MGETTTDQGDFLADPQSPALDRAALARVGDPGRPDRLAWNTFRTLSASASACRVFATGSQTT